MATAEATGTGVSFALTEEQRALRDLAHEFAEKEIRPVAAEYDESEEFPWPVLKKAGEIGLYGLEFYMETLAGDPTGLMFASDAFASSALRPVLLAMRATASAAMSVSTQPGHSALIVTPVRARSIASARVIPTSACFAAQYAAV